MYLGHSLFIEKTSGMFFFNISSSFDSTSRVDAVFSTYTLCTS